MNVGPVTIEGADDSAKTGFENGSVEFLGGELDSSDKGHVALSHISFTGFGEVGALSTADAALNIRHDVGHPGLEASSVTLDRESKLDFQIDGGESAQLLSEEGPIALEGATLALDVSPAANGGSCSALEVGSKYTFVSTSEEPVGSVRQRACRRRNGSADPLPRGLRPGTGDADRLPDGK